MEEQIRQILAETLDIDPEEITPEKRLIADLGLTSFDLADVVLQAQEEFGVTLPSSFRSRRISSFMPAAPPPPRGTRPPR